VLEKSKLQKNKVAAAVAGIPLGSSGSTKKNAAMTAIAAATAWRQSLNP
jgi:hypothetical protein